MNAYATPPLPNSLPTPLPILLPLDLSPPTEAFAYTDRLLREAVLEEQEEAAQKTAAAMGLPVPGARQSHPRYACCRPAPASPRI